ncbi:MAG: putative BRCA2 protein [Streblomastix strix]|uniref:Putative BRCA2 protein n=1 Tax=Streblomastix strix TaxID=222440 RepID=A0A5J4WYN1_9EUKA|nr:MAG: putative BRCA2 protein [Streblomastix strix]
MDKEEDIEIEKDKDKESLMEKDEDKDKLNQEASSFHFDLRTFPEFQPPFPNALNEIQNNKQQNIKSRDLNGGKESTFSTSFSMDELNEVQFKNSNLQQSSSLPPNQSQSSALMNLWGPKQAFQCLTQTPLKEDDDYNDQEQEEIDWDTESENVDYQFGQKKMIQSKEEEQSNPKQDSLIKQPFTFSSQIKAEWVHNHWRWIVWKLSCYERSFPYSLGTRSSIPASDYVQPSITSLSYSKQQTHRSLLSPQVVLHHLLKRAYSEFELAQRSCIRKITEGDEAIGRHMILCIARILSVGRIPQKTSGIDNININEQNENINEIDEQSRNMRQDYQHNDQFHQSKSQPSSQSISFIPGYVELTDGWYSIKAELDYELTRNLQMGKIQEGLKLRIFGAELVNLGRNAHPLELCSPLGYSNEDDIDYQVDKMLASVQNGSIQTNNEQLDLNKIDSNESTSYSLPYIKLHINGTRRAIWNSKLGFQSSPTFPILLKSIKPDGGIIPMCYVCVQRIYPPLYLVKKEEYINDDNKDKTSSPQKIKDDSNEEEDNEQVPHSFIRCEASQHIADSRFEKALQLKAEQLSVQFEREMELKLAQFLRKYSGKQSAAKVKMNPSPTQIHTSQLQIPITQTQMHQIQNRGTNILSSSIQSIEERELANQKKQQLLDRFKEKTQADLSIEMQKKMNEFTQKRDVIYNLSFIAPQSTFITIWRPSEDLIGDALKEGSILQIHSLQPAKRQMWRKFNSLTSKQFNKNNQQDQDQETDGFLGRIFEDNNKVLNLGLRMNQLRQKDSFPFQTVWNTISSSPSFNSQALSQIPKNIKIIEDTSEFSSLLPQSIQQEHIIDKDATNNNLNHKSLHIHPLYYIPRIAFTIAQLEVAPVGFEFDGAFMVLFISPLTITTRPHFTAQPNTSQKQSSNSSHLRSQAELLVFVADQTTVDQPMVIKIKRDSLFFPFTNPSQSLQPQTVTSQPHNSSMLFQEGSIICIRNCVLDEQDQKQGVVVAHGPEESEFISDGASVPSYLITARTAVVEWRSSPLAQETIAQLKEKIARITGQSVNQAQQNNIILCSFCALFITYL